MNWSATLLAGALFVFLGGWLIRRRSWPAQLAFAALNLAVLYLFVAALHGNATQRFDHRFAAMFLLSNAVLLVIQYLTLCWTEGTALWLIAFLLPIAFLAALRYLPLGPLLSVLPGMHGLLRDQNMNLAAHFIGYSYIAFRSSLLVLELRNRVVPRPSIFEYFSFALFAPTLAVGPISPYSQHSRAYRDPGGSVIPKWNAFLRVLCGAVKFKFLSPLLYQLTYGGLLLDGHLHPWEDLPLAVIAYYLYLFCNFSGFCDVAVGVAGLMNVPVAENFDSPFRARNMKDFWNRWHITLSLWMRDIVFTPLCTALVRLVGPKWVNHAVAFAIVVVFLLIGIWHGTGLHYAVFGAVCALGVAANHYYTVWLKRHLSKAQFAAYNRNRIIHASAVAVTFLYVASSMFFFANTGDDAHKIFTALRWH